MSEHVTEVTDSSFMAEVLQAPGLVMVDFWAPWCGPCRMMGPVVDQIARELDGKLKVAKLNVDQNPLVSQDFQIRGIPAILFFLGGRKVGEMVGAAPAPALKQRIAQLQEKIGSPVAA